jgi:outer membrane receptor protein involved in Fe transport
VTGTEYAIQHVNTANPQGLQTLLSRPIYTNKGAVFGQMDRSLTESLSLELSGRVDASTLHPTQFSPRVAAVYAITPKHELRATYNQGFQVASHVELFIERPIGRPLNLSGIENSLAPLLGGVPLGLSSVPLIALGNENLQVEKIRTAEFGYKAVILGRGFFSVTYFHNWMKNFISDAFPGGNPSIPPYVAPSSLPANVQAIVTSTLNKAVTGISNLPGGQPFVALSLTNTGRVESQGAEAEISTDIARHFRAGGNYAYFNFQIGEQKPGTQVHPNAPRNTFSTFGSFYSRRFTANLRYRWVQGLYWANGLLTGPVPAYGVADFAALYNLSRHYKLGLQIDNFANNAHYEVFGGDVLKRRTLGYMAYSW